MIIFRSSQLEFPKHQVWCKTVGRQIGFIDQTLETTRHYHEDSQSDASETFFDAEVDPLLGDPAATEPNFASTESETRWVGSAEDPSTNFDHNPAPLALEPESSDPNGQFDVGDDDPLVSLHYLPSGSPAFVSTPPKEVHQQWDQDVPISYYTRQPSHDRVSVDLSCEERRLLKNFVDTIGPTLDFCDPYNKLAVWIFEKALNYPDILQMVMRLSNNQLRGISTGSPVHPELDNTSLSAARALLFRLTSNIEGKY